MHKRMICGAALSLTLLQGAVWAQELVRDGEQFQVNSYTNNTQYRPNVGVGANGSFVVVWAGNGGSVGPDDSAGSIQGQHYSSSGERLGSQFQVNSLTSMGQYMPKVSVSPNGEFVVTWLNDHGSYENDDDLSSVQAQRYSSGGARLGAQFQINTYTTSLQGSPDVSFRPDGEFVVVWRSSGSSESDHDFESVQGQRFSSSGDELGSQFQVNSDTLGRQFYPAISVGPDGGFVVVWQSSTPDNHNNTVQGQRYDSQGDELGSQFQVNTYSGEASIPVVSVGPNGFLVVWRSTTSPGSDQDGDSIQGRLYDSEGVELRPQFQVNNLTPRDQYSAAVSLDPAGGFVVVWGSFGLPGSDDDASIQAQRFSSSGVEVGSQFLVNSYTNSGQYMPSVSAGGGHLVVVWQSYGSAESDNSEGSIQGQRLALATPTTAATQTPTVTTTRTPTATATVTATGVPMPASPDPRGSALPLVGGLSVLLGLLLLRRARA